MEPDAELEERLSQPTAPLVDAMRSLAGDLVVLGVGGKMGPSLARLARRASDQAGARRRIIGVARFSTPGLRQQLERDGVETLAVDLLDPEQVARLPDAEHVVLMVGQKFGTSSDEPRTWATNVWAPGLIATRYRTARIVAFSTGNVYPLWPVDSSGPVETDPVDPVGEYAQSALARERLLTFLADRFTTPLAILRLNYAVEPRYGVLRDIADRVRARQPIDLSMGYVNVIWQRDANAIALRALAHAATPPLVLNLTGAPAVSVRSLALAFGERFGVTPVFTGTERETALLSNAAACLARFGPLPVGIDEMVDMVAAWMLAGGRSLEKPTHFQEREGRF
jgi:nucleoside-diphosphate-sugar epimerase